MLDSQQPRLKRDSSRLLPLLHALGDPHRAFPAVHVGGTNGKGSVCALVDSVVRASGFKVARYTSPHLESVTERMAFDGADISGREFETTMTEVRAAVRLLGERGEAVGPYSEFDLLTAAAYYWFAARKPDVAVVEVGLGGRTDATNVLESPIATVLTNVSLDHTEVLGSDEELIAGEKAGIIKDGRNILTQATGRAYRVISGIARERKAHLKQVGNATFVSALPAGQRVGYKGRMWELGLLGTYQLQNVTLALESINLLRAEGLDIPDEAVRRGLLDVTWPGRMEAWDRQRGRWLFDGAHNPAGAAELASSLRRHFPGEEYLIVFGAIDGKPGNQMVRTLAPLAQSLILTAPPSERALPPEKLAEGIRGPEVRVMADPAEAIAEAARMAKGRLIVVCGSLYLVGLARELARSIG
jgi:dihydrofolate synthase/folylpolyglutamate synthase